MKRRVAPLVALAVALASSCTDTGAGIRPGEVATTSQALTWTIEQKLVAPDAANNDWHGWAVGLLGDTAVVVSSLDDTLSGPGSAYIYERTAGSWSYRTKLVPDDPAKIGSLKNMVGIDGSTVVVTAQSAAYVFTGSGASWSQQALLQPSTPQNSNYPADLALSGDTVIVGSLQDDEQASGAGSAFVFERSGSTWSEVQKLFASDASIDQYFGASVDLDGDLAVIGAVEDDTQGTNAGAAYVFERISGTWVEQAKIFAGDSGGNSRFGKAVAVDGTTVAVAGGQGAGAGVYVFVESGGAWTQQQKLPGDSLATQSFGSSLALSGDVVVAGDALDSQFENEGGAAYVFTRSASSWTLEAKVAPPQASMGTIGARFGSSVAVNGNTALVGAPYDDPPPPGGDWGAAYVFVGITGGGQANGTSCTSGADCTSGVCWSGICCENACSGRCQTCLRQDKAAGPDGECGPARDGIDPGDHCSENTTGCGWDGQCDGAGECRYKAAGVSCGATSCNGNLAIGQVCTGTGGCIDDQTGTDCAPYLCKSGGCANPCVNNDDCVTGLFCDQGTCRTLQPAGAPCTSFTQCTSGFCADGVCCDGTCDTPCTTCLQVNKASGPDGECGPVRDGVDPRDDCQDEGASTCGLDGACDGAGACRRYPSGASCGATSCDGNLVVGDVCDGNGQCTSSSTGTPCSPYACVGAACASPCAAASDCVPGNFCDLGTCKETLLDGANCSASAQCTSGVCDGGICGSGMGSDAGTGGTGGVDGGGGSSGLDGGSDATSSGGSGGASGSGGAAGGTGGGAGDGGTTSPGGTAGSIPSGDAAPTEAGPPSPRGDDIENFYSCSACTVGGRSPGRDAILFTSLTLFALLRRRPTRANRTSTNDVSRRRGRRRSAHRSR